MLNQLKIHNLAVVDEIDVEFDGGFTALTGETGAGKSILVDALALALGERADSRAIRSGSDRCEITATFDLGGCPDVTHWLVDHDLDEDGECILRRVVTAEGRSRGYINGRTVPMQTLRELGEQLVDICGQQSYQSLRHPIAQRRLLDQYGGHEKLLEAMRRTHTAWHEARTKLDALILARRDLRERQELLSYQVSELRALNIQQGEIGELEQEHLRISNSSRIAEIVSTALQQLYEADAGAALATISDSRNQLDGLAELDHRLATITALLAEAEILITEAADSLRSHLNGIEHDPRLLEQLEQRIADIHEISRKHRVKPETLFELQTSLERELSEIENSDERIAELSENTDRLEADMQAAARKLTGARRETAAKLREQVTANMQNLGMSGGIFEVDLRSVPDREITPVGADRIEFLVSANPGLMPGPLAKVASGGELSRLSLALQVVAIATDTVPTLIFDEVDAGVGGSVAEIVGSQLLELSLQCQVLCVTHLPQVASQAAGHLRVTKISDGVSTRTSVKGLTEPERVEEIARMLGGVEITARTRAHAAEMLKRTKLKESAG